MSLDPSLSELAAADCPTCDGCDEPYCLECQMHYADCPHPGPHSEEEDFSMPERAPNETFDWEASRARPQPDGPTVRPDSGLAGPGLRDRADGGDDPHQALGGGGAIQGGPGPQDPRWRNRIASRADVDPRALIPHPENFRLHPESQREVLAATIAEVGWVGEVYVSALSGRILDGHARVEEAIRTDQPSVPVAYVDCEDEADEERILATFNPVGELARTDDGKLAELVNRANFSGGATGPIVRALAGLVGTSKTPKEEPGGRVIGSAFGVQGGGSGSRQLGEVGGLVYPVVVECETAHEQDTLLEQLAEEGHAAYAMDACPSSLGDRPRD